MEPVNAIMFPSLSYISPIFSWNIPTLLLSARNAIFISSRPAAIKLLSKFRRSSSYRPVTFFNSRNSASSITSSCLLTPSLMACISSSDSLGDAISSILPPFSTRPQIPEANSTREVDEKNPIIYDGKKWFISPYDLDQTFGYFSGGICPASYYNTYPLTAQTFKNYALFAWGVKYYMDEIQEYLKMCPSESYSKLIRDIFNNIPETTISYKNAGYMGDDNKFHVTLTPESGRYLLNVTYTIYEQNQDGSLGNPIISKYVNDKDVDWNNLDFTVDYDGKCFEIEGHPVMATQVDDSTDAEIYMSKVTRNGVPESFRFAVLNGLFSNKLQQVGVVLFDNDVGTASRDVFPLKPGDEIEVNGKSFTIGRNGLTLNSRDINVSKYFVQVVAVDMFGKEFKSDIFAMNK